MLLDTLVYVKYNNRTKQRYLDLGYKVEKPGFYVSQKDLTQGYNGIVKIKCDKCGKIFDRLYSVYIRAKKNNPDDLRDFCCECNHYPERNKKIQEKRQNTCLNKYGFKSASQNESVKEKGRKTLIENGGYSFQRKDILEKALATVKEKYNGSPMLIPEFKEKAIQTNLKKYGVRSTALVPEIKQKQLDSLYKNGNCPTSKQQIWIYETLCKYFKEVELNKPIGRYLLDIAVNIDDCKIDIEYDGWYWHQNKDIARNNFVFSNGFKILRIKSGNLFPSENQLLENINELVCTNCKYKEIILEDWK